MRRINFLKGFLSHGWNVIACLKSWTKSLRQEIPYCQSDNYSQTKKFWLRQSCFHVKKLFKGALHLYWFRKIASQIQPLPGKHLEFESLLGFTSLFHVGTVHAVLFSLNAMMAVHILLLHCLPGCLWLTTLSIHNCCGFFWKIMGSPMLCHWVEKLNCRPESLLQMHAFRLEDLGFTANMLLCNCHLLKSYLAVIDS